MKTNMTSPQTELGQDEKAVAMRMELYDWLHCVLTALLAAVLIFIFVGRNINVDGSSMEGTLIHGDRLIVSNLFYTPSNGDIIVFHSPTLRFAGTPLVKRVIAIPGQEIDFDFDRGHVIVDGMILQEDYLDPGLLTTAQGNFVGPKVIPDGYVFVLGDNRNLTIDSRHDDIGLVDTRYILGRVLMVMVPGVDNDGIREWSRIGIPN
jgi:signal peptidase I